MQNKKINKFRNAIIYNIKPNTKKIYKLLNYRNNFVDLVDHD